MHVIYAHFVSKENLCVMFITKRLKLFSYPPFPTSPFDISCVILISKSKNWTVNELAKQKIINYHIKGLHKTTCYKAKSNFPQSFFSH